LNFFSGNQLSKSTKSIYDFKNQIPQLLLWLLNTFFPTATLEISNQLSEWIAIQMLNH